MRILAFSGSLRDESFNSGLLRSTRQLAPEGVEFELYTGISELPIFDADLESRLPQKVSELNKSIREADALVIATPEYNGSIPGGLIVATGLPVSAA